MVHDLNLVIGTVRVDRPAREGTVLVVRGGNGHRNIAIDLVIALGRGGLGQMVRARLEPRIITLPLSGVTTSVVVPDSPASATR